jgi:group I intron endonuclease
MICGIYKLENIINHKVYIGKSENIENRFILHKRELNNGNHCNQHLLAAWRKYGEKNFIFSILDNCEVNDLNEKEIFWIETLKSYKKEFGYNKTLGGTGGRLNDESLEKMRQSLIGKKLSEETKQKLSNNHKKNKVNVAEKNGMFGATPWNKGKTKDNDPILAQMSIKELERIKNIVNPKIGVKRTEEVKKKISKAHTGKLKTVEHRKNISLANLGKKLSLETCLKMSLSRRNKPQKKITCPHCSKMGGTTMHRWHFDFCKKRTVS